MEGDGQRGGSSRPPVRRDLLPERDAVHASQGVFLTDPHRGHGGPLSGRNKGEER